MSQNSEMVDRVGFELRRYVIENIGILLCVDDTYHKSYHKSKALILRQIVRFLR